MAATARAGATGQAVAERITVALIPRAADDLRQLQDNTGMSKTDLTNRAITLYRFIEARLSAGDELLIRSHETGQTQTVHVL
jgi:hypothetical protein